MSAKINNLRNLRKKDFEIIKRISLLGAHIKNKVNKGISEAEEEALFNLISKCGDEAINEVGNLGYDMDIDNDLINEYNELVFWEVLAKKLAARDTLEELGEVINQNNFEVYETTRRGYEEQYLKKFNFSKVKINVESSVKEKEIIFDNSLLPY
ncbi:hypothetical protein [uncultured Clostridium sp.]|uniref:hypothetical protein n=1 Tax=uncultured Clostridium sp. TaxID=59620 RepID=UPI002620866C|nr:hypothetical protein [uncultured Clostridium sp.]